MDSIKKGEFTLIPKVFALRRYCKSRILQVEINWSTVGVGSGLKMFKVHSLLHSRTLDWAYTGILKKGVIIFFFKPWCQVLNTFPTTPFLYSFLDSPFFLRNYFLFFLSCFMFLIYPFLSLFPHCCFLSILSPFLFSIPRFLYRNSGRKSLSSFSSNLGVKSWTMFSSS